MELQLFSIDFSYYIIFFLGACIFILLFKKPNNSSLDVGSLKMLQDHLLHLSKTLDVKLSENRNVTQKNFDINANISREANKQIEEITKKLTSLENTNNEIKSIWQQLEGLESILKNPKRRWNLWEYFLKELLQNVFQEWSYALQYTLGDKWVVDAALFIGGKIIPVDSKFPYDNYEKLIHAEHELDIKNFSNLLKWDIKKRIDETAKYIDASLDTTDFAFMLLPAEGLYYDIFIAKVWDISVQELTSYAFSKKVIICSPSGFYAYLQTVIQGLRYLKVEEDVREVVRYVSKLEKDLHKYRETFSKLGNSLWAVQNHYEAADKRLDIIDTDIVKIQKVWGENLEK